MSWKENINCTGTAGKISDHWRSNCFLKINTGGNKTRGAGNLFQHFTTRTENAPLLRRRGSEKEITECLVVKHNHLPSVAWAQLRLPPMGNFTPKNTHSWAFYINFTARLTVTIRLHKAVKSQVLSFVKKHYFESLSHIRIESHKDNIRQFTQKLESNKN